MVSWAVWAGFAAGGLLLLVAGIGHVLRRRHLAAVLATHRLRPPWPRLIAATLGVVEIVVGTATTVTVGTGAAGTVAGALGALMYAAFAVYLLRLLRVAPGVDCGCFGADEPVSRWTVARAVLLALACAVVVGVGSPARTVGERGALLAAGVVVALMLSVATSVASLVTGPAQD